MATKDGFIRTGKTFQDPPAIQGDFFTESTDSQISKSTNSQGATT
jgi:hypothetical protein